MDDRQTQIDRLTRILGHINVPAGDGYPAIDMAFVGPTARVAAHLYDVEGVRVAEPEGGNG